MEKSPISTLQTFFILMGSTGLLNHVLIIPMLLQTVGRDAWVSVLVSGAIALLWVPLLYLIVKKTKQQHLIQWVTERYGTFVGKSLAALLILYLMFVNVVTFKDTLNWTKTSYLPQTPKLVLFCFFALLCFYNCYYGLQSIALTAGVLIPIVIVFGFFVAFGNSPQKDYEQLKPILEHGLAPIWRGILYSGAGFVEILYLMLIQHHLKKKIRIRTLLLLVLSYIWLTIGPLVGAITEFGHYAAADLRYPAYEEWRLLMIGRYVEHVDFLSIYQWLVGAFLRISISIYLIPELLQVQQQKQRVFWMLGAFLVLGFLTLWPLSDMSFYRLLTQFGIPSGTVYLGALSLLFLVLALFKGKRKRV